jgi:uncharacterized protein with PhoU and TrkA domain
LTALLTIGTSNTQLGGTQIGTALNTIFSRMRRLTVNKYTADVNGESMTANDAEAALQTIGVDLWENGAANGQMRSSFDILVDVAEAWETMSDAQKNIVGTALAGTRMMNVFSTLMEGMDAETLKKYLSLAEDSTGLTQDKYEIAMKSLKASIDEVRSSYDAMVEAFVNNGAVTTTLDLFSGLLQLIAGLGQTDGGKFATIFNTIAAGITAVAVATKLAAGPLGTITGLISGLAVLAGMTGLSTIFFGSKATAEQRHLEEYNSSVDTNVKHATSVLSKTGKAEEAISEVKKAGEAIGDINEQADTSNLVKSLNNLAEVFPEVSDVVKEAIADLENWNEYIDEIEDRLEKINDENFDTFLYNATSAMESHYNTLYRDDVVAGNDTV